MLLRILGDKELVHPLVGEWVLGPSEAYEELVPLCRTRALLDSPHQATYLPTSSASGLVP